MALVRSAIGVVWGLKVGSIKVETSVGEGLGCGMIVLKSILNPGRSLMKVYLEWIFFSPSKRFYDLQNEENIYSPNFQMDGYSNANDFTLEGSSSSLSTSKISYSDEELSWEDALEKLGVEV
ncbi:hypothetical protein HMI54_009266 [Coelomomyces lativittatus]|nr:hypothetical protein HMI54_009266 [Coelomomyces lativittatus]